MESWNGDDELFGIMNRELFSAVVGDILDEYGYLDQFLPPRIKPLSDNMSLVGRAMPVLESDIEDRNITGLPDKPFGLMLEALDSLKRNEVYICSGASPTYALWGELMSTRAIKLEAAGAVVDGYSRDTRGILKLKFPTFSYGTYSQDQKPRGKVIDFGIPIKLGNVSIKPGDIIFGDMDGVCVIPQEAEFEVINAALDKARKEKIVKKAIENGMSACKAFEKYGVM